MKARDTTVTVICRTCDSAYELRICADDLAAYINGEKMAKDAFPYLSDDERELLISSTCGECWEKMFPPEEE